MITGHHDGGVAIWQIESGRILEQFEAHNGWVEAMSVSPDGRYLATGGPDRMVKLWDLVDILKEASPLSDASQALLPTLH